MQRIAKAAGLFVALFACAGILHAQPQAVLSISTNFPEAIVYIDSVRVGPASQREFHVPATAGEVRLVAEARGSWTIEPVRRRLALTADSLHHVRMDFPYHYHVQSIPFDADVYLEGEGARRRIGKTPMTYWSSTPLDSMIVIEAPGYGIQRAEPGQEVWNEVEFVLDPLEGRSRATEIAWTPPSQPRRWIDYAALGLAATAGALTVHYKFKADGLYDRYEETGDPDLRPEIKSLDARAGVALGAMQVGVGVLAFRFIIRR